MSNEKRNTENNKLGYQSNEQSIYGAYNRQKNEVGLMDLWRLFVQYKFMILGCIVFSQILVIIYLSLSNPIYQVNASLMIGQHSGNRMESNESLVQRLNGKYGVSVRRDINNVYILISKRGEDPNQIYHSVEKLVKEILKYHKYKYDSQTKNNELLSDAIKKHLKLIEGDLKVMESLKLQLKNAALVNLLSERHLSQNSRLRLQKELWALGLSDIDNKMTYMKVSPSLPTSPVWPNKIAYIISAAFGGMMLGFMIALMRGFNKISI